MKCDNVENGCKWEGELGNLDTHLNTCDYALLPCDNNCTNNGQAVKMFMADKQDHLTNHCPRRQYKCPHCEEMGEHQERTSTHLEICPQVSIPCPNSLFCTAAAIPRCELPAHRSTCQYEHVPCKYAEVGCKEKRRRIDHKEHEENDQIHLKVTTAKVLELTQQLSEHRKMLDETNVRLTTVEQLTFKLDGFQKHKNDKTAFCSNCFYISHKGYKFRIQAYAGGAGSGEGTHVSMYASLMKGDYDNALTWPFLGEATFELLNQIEDKNHHKSTTRFNFNNNSCQRVVEGEGGIKGRGIPNFIAHTDLAYNPANNCQYLKDDALIFRVSVRPPSYKPWLQCTHD